MSVTLLKFREIVIEALDIYDSSDLVRLYDEFGDEITDADVYLHRGNVLDNPQCLEF